MSTVAGAHTDEISGCGNSKALIELRTEGCSITANVYRFTLTHMHCVLRHTKHLEEFGHKLTPKLF